MYIGKGTRTRVQLHWNRDKKNEARVHEVHRDEGTEVKRNDSGKRTVSKG